MVPSEGRRRGFFADDVCLVEATGYSRVPLSLIAQHTIVTFDYLYYDSALRY
jgi:hypothetical protein